MFRLTPSNFFLDEPHSWTTWRKNIAQLWSGIKTCGKKMPAGILLKLILGNFAILSFWWILCPTKKKKSSGRPGWEDDGGGRVSGDTIFNLENYKKNIYPLDLDSITFCICHFWSVISIQHFLIIKINSVYNEQNLKS